MHDVLRPESAGIVCMYVCVCVDIKQLRGMVAWHICIMLFDLKMQVLYACMCVCMCVCIDIYKRRSEVAWHICMMLFDLKVQVLYACRCVIYMCMCVYIYRYIEALYV